MSSVFSVSGLASGLDTEGIVRQLLQIERIPITQAERRQADLRALDTAWSGVVSKLSAVRTALDDLDTTTDYAAHRAVTSSQPDAVAVTRTGAPAAGGLSFTVTQLAQAYQGSLSGATSFTSGDDAVGAGSITIRHADAATGATIDTTGLTLAEVASAISGHADIDANASVQRLADGTARLLVSSRRSGQDGGLVFDLSGAPAGLDTETELFAAADAQLTMGSGAGALVVSSASNRMTDLIAGVTVDLLATTTTPVAVGVEADTAVTVEKVRALVDAINGALGDLTTKTRFDAGSGAAGALQGSATATALRFDLAAVLGGAVAGLTGSYTSGADVGIELTREGTLTLDEDALAAALADDRDGVVALFTTAASGGTGPGLFTALDELLDGYEGADGRIAATRDGLAQRIADHDDQIARHEDRLELRERLLRQKFSGLESALAVLQAQGAGLLAQLGLGQQAP